MKVLFLDLETTGLTEKDHIWQIAWVKGIEDGKTLRLIEGRESWVGGKGTFLQFLHFCHLPQVRGKGKVAFATFSQILI